MKETICFLPLTLCKILAGVTSIGNFDIVENDGIEVHFKIVKMLNRFIIAKPIYYVFQFSSAICR